MPTYDYECGSCNHKYELFQSITAKPVRKCPSCGRQTAKRLIGTGGGVIFRGSGFYQTDYRSEGYKKSAKSETDSSSSSKSTSESTSASPPSTKSESPKSTGSDKGGSKGKKKDS